MEFIWLLLVGLIAGWLAGVLVRGGGFGVLGDMVVGILGALIGGSVIVESVFAWPGLGMLAFEALFARDLNLLLGIFLLSALLVVAINLIVDVIYSFLDPRIEVG